MNTVPERYLKMITQPILSYGNKNGPDNNFIKLVGIINL